MNRRMVFVVIDFSRLNLRLLNAAQVGGKRVLSIPVCTWLGQGSILSRIAVLCYLHIMERWDYDNLHRCQSFAEVFFLFLNLVLLFLFVLTLVIETCRNDVVGFSLNDRFVQN